MYSFQKYVVSLWRISRYVGYRTLLEKKTLVVCWVSETAKNQSPEIRQPVSVYIDTDYCSCRGKALGGAIDTTVKETVLFVYN